MALELMYITNDPEIVLIAQKYGVDRIFVDLETLGKEARQHNMNTVKSHHSIEDISVISPLLTNAKLLVRINPWNDNSVTEVDRVIEAGADLIMLPMWTSVEEVSAFVKAVGGRVKTVLLLETKEAEGCLDDVLKLPGIDEIHVGLNDLHLSYGLSFMFELLSNGTVEKICRKIAQAGIPYGFGGIAKIGEGMLPAEKIITEHFRLGSTRAILSRSFCNYTEIRDVKQVDRIFCENMKKLRNFEDSLQGIQDKDLEANRREVCDGVEKIVSIMRERKND